MPPKIKIQRKQLRPPRNWLAVLAHRRQAGPLRDRREGRGGARNLQRDLQREE